MASNAATSPAGKPLAFMTQLSPCVYFYRPTAPPAQAIPSQKPAPKLIVLASWMGAREPHIAKYLVQYQALFPSSPILLLRAEPRHFLRPRGTAHEFAPAVPVVRSIFPELLGGAATADNDKQTTPPQRPEILIHAWSNGGVSALLSLRRALLGATPAPLPPYTLVLDSTPGRFRYRAAYLAFTTGLTGIAKWLVAPVMHLVCAWYWLKHVLVGRGRTGPLEGLRTALNDAASRRSEVRRAYVYGERDRLVHWRDVEGHAAEAEARGFSVRTEKFDGGEHVAHARVDPQRYWRVVRETWEGLG